MRGSTDYRRVYNNISFVRVFCYRGVKVNRFGDLYYGRRAIFAAFV